MKERKKRWRLLVFVAMGLVVVALLSISSSAWATPAQNRAQQTVGPFKEATGGCQGQHATFTIWFTNGSPWTNVVITDNIDPRIRIDSVAIQCQPGPCPAGTTVSGPGVNPVVVTIPTLPQDTTVTITIECYIPWECPVGTIVNVGIVTFTDPTGRWQYAPTASLTIAPCFVPEAGSMLLLASGLAGLAGYAGLRWRVRRK